MEQMQHFFLSISFLYQSVVVSLVCRSNSESGNRVKNFINFRRTFIPFHRENHELEEEVKIRYLLLLPRVLSETYQYHVIL